MGWVFTGIILAAMVAQGHIGAKQVGQLAAKREDAFGIAMAALLAPGLLGLMFAALLSAQMATLSALMVNSSALASRNLYMGVIRPKASDREVLMVGRVIGLFLVTIAVLLAHALRDVADALTMLLQFASIMGVVVWGGVLWRRANAPGAWAAVIVLVITWCALGPVGELIKSKANHADAARTSPATSTLSVAAAEDAGRGSSTTTTTTTRQSNAIAPSAIGTGSSAMGAAGGQGDTGRGAEGAGGAGKGAATSTALLPDWVGRYAGKRFVPQLMVRYLPPGVAALVIVSLLTKPPNKKRVDDFFMLLRTPVGQEQKLIDAGIPIVYAGSSTANALEAKHPRLVHWGGFALAALVCVGVLGLLYLLASLGR
jgi:hypothetical protein